METTAIQGIDIRPAASGADRVPERDRLRIVTTVCVLGALAWDYAETVREIASQMRITATKALSRSVRQLRLDYDSRRRSVLDQAHLRREAELGELFGEICRDHFSRLCIGVASEKLVAGLSDDQMMLVKAVHEAVAVTDALRLYADEADRWIASYGVTGVHSVLPDHFRRLAVLLPEFAGDCYNRDSESRKLTARILLAEMKQVYMFDDNGEV